MQNITLSFLNISFRKESGSNANLDPHLQVHNNQLGPAPLYIIGGTRSHSLGASPLTSRAWARKVYQSLLHPLSHT